MTRIFTTIFLFSLGLVGCQTQPVIDDGPDEVLYFEPVGMGHSGSTRDTLEVVFKDQIAFEQAMTALRPLGVIPDIDFSQTMVGLIAVPTESGGYVVEVKSVEKTADQIVVTYEFATPGEDCVTIQALSLPFQLVKIKRSEGNVTFNRISKRYSCGM